MTDPSRCLLEISSVNPSPAEALRGDLEVLTDLAERMLDTLADLSAALEEVGY